MNSNSKVRKIAFVGDHLPRKCGIATFTSDLLAAVASAHPQNRCLAVSVNDIPGGLTGGFRLADSGRHSTWPACHDPCIILSSPKYWLRLRT